MQFIKASERLPPDPFKNVIVRNLRTGEVGLGKTMGFDSIMHCDFAGWNSTKGGCKFDEIEWLDESETQPVEPVFTLQQALNIFYDALLMDMGGMSVRYPIAKKYFKDKHGIDIDNLK